MTTALDIIKKAMLKGGIIVKQEIPDSDEASDALDELNNMLDEWSNESLLIISRDRESFQSTGAVSYTIGDGGDFDTTRPMYIIDLFVRIGNVDYPASPVTDSNYSLIQQKNIPGLPEFYNYSNSYELGKLYLYPYPSSDYTIHIYSEKQINNIASLNSTINFPPGWKSALIYNLAIRLCSEYGQEISLSLADMAATSLAAIKRQVSKTRSKDAYPQILRCNNIYTGYNS